MEGDTVSEAASTTDNETGPPEGTGENVVQMEDEKENGVVEEAEKQPDAEAAKIEEGSGGKEVEEVEEGGPEEEKESEDNVEGEDGDAKMEDMGSPGEEKERKGNGGSDVKEETESKGEEIEEEGDVEEEEKHGEVEKKDEESKEEVKQDAGRAEMEEEGDMKEGGEHEEVEKKAQESKEKGLTKRRRGQRGERKRKEEKVEIKKKGPDEKEDVKKKEADGDKGARGKRKVDEEKVAAKKEEKDEKKGEDKKRKVDREKEDAKKDVDEKKPKELSTPVASSLDRPVRERKSVERLVVAIENEPVKELVILKGRGTPLKDIPNVAYKLSKKKSDDTVKLLHAIIYGRRGKASQIKSNISQFSGFVWNENEEKQQAKIKERLDKHVKNKLIEFCDVLDIPVARATARKEDLVSKMLDFLMAPHATTDLLLAEKDQPSKSNKRKRTVNIGASKKSGITSAKRSPRKRRKIGDTPKPKEKSASDTEDDDEQEEGVKNENGIPDADVDEPSEHSESEKDEDEQDNDESRKIKHGFNSSWGKSVEDVSVKKVRTPKKISLATPAKSVQKTYSRQSKSKPDDTSDTSPRVFSRKKKNEDTLKKKPSTSSKSTPKAKAGKKVAKEKDKPKKKESGPSEEELRKTICEILKAVDFNTATFTDILKQLTSHFNADLAPRKSAIKLMIHDELTKLADEAEDDEDEESDDEKEEDSRPAGKVEA
eukprot:TRINITY_DN2867_c0_g2_i1.p1 TRINITY_DN2867_c0_g2~~TRINITY_DN2867_c0_g2_i1.p1  ORF type:complete len:712 (+),score=291.46 TRINITY_DN2867_c0_g2_i1:224-2359(+)